MLCQGPHRPKTGSSHKPSVAGESSVILLHPPLPSAGTFNRDEKGDSYIAGKITVSPAAAQAACSGSWPDAPESGVAAAAAGKGKVKA